MYLAERDGHFQDAQLEEFYPHVIEEFELPDDVPEEIEKEFREAEVCAGIGANRAAAALFRSALEKTLKLNGYVKQGNRLKDLYAKIDEASSDHVITDPLRRRAHDEVRTLGNDVLHDEWRIVTDDEVALAHRYTQRIIEAFYDTRDEVEKILKAKNRIPP